MRVIDLGQIAAWRQSIVVRRRVVRRRIWVLSLVALTVTYSYLAYQRPLPDAVPVVTAVDQGQTSPVSFKWPSIGQAAFGSPGYGILASSPSQAPAPTASVAKVITALVVLRKQPLKLGTQGPLLILSAEDVEYYNFYSANNGSNIRVEDGEKLSLYQALQALIIPSANNIAESLARWAFGSQTAYVEAANKLVKELGMTHTNVADASGFSPKTVSTAEDLVLLGIAAMNQPVLTEVFGQTTASLPLVGELRSTNRLLSQEGYIGIKTGNTEEAGGCYLFAVRRQLFGLQVPLVGAVMSAPTLADAMEYSKSISSQAFQGFRQRTVVAKGQQVASYKYRWGSTNHAAIDADLKVVAWQDEKLAYSSQLESLKAEANPGASLGLFGAASKLQKSTQNVTVGERNTLPSFWWRLFRL